VVEQASLVAGPETVEDHGLVADLEPGEQTRLATDRWKLRQGLGRNQDVIPGPADRHDDTVAALLHHLALEVGDHLAASRVTRRIRACWRWHTATATASAASGSAGTPFIPNTRVRLRWIDSFEAVPTPVTAIFTVRGGCSSTGNPASAAASRITPVALDTSIALWVLRPHIRRSMAIAVGRCRAIASRTASWIRRSRSGPASPEGVRYVAAHLTDGVVPADSTTP